MIFSRPLLLFITSKERFVAPPQGMADRRATDEIMGLEIESMVEFGWHDAAALALACFFLLPSASAAVSVTMYCTYSDLVILLAPKSGGFSGPDLPQL